MKSFLVLIRCYHYAISSKLRLRCLYRSWLSYNAVLAVVSNLAPSRIPENGVLPVQESRALTLFPNFFK